MAYIIRIYYKDELYSMDLSQYSSATIGSGENDTIKLNAGGLNGGHIRFDMSADCCTIRAKKRLYRADGNSKITKDKIEEGIRYILKTNPEIYIAVHPKQADSDRAVVPGEKSEITIGRSYKNSIVLANMRTSSEHCMIYKVGNKYILKDLGSKNGTFVNGKKVFEKALNDKDIINISIYRINFENETLSFDNVGDDIDFNIETQPRGADKIDERTGREGTTDMYGRKIKKHEDGTLSLYK